MRTYGRVNQTNGVGGVWVEVDTDAQGYNDNVYLTSLIQGLRLNLGESPFYANYGIPAQQSIITQVFPDFYVAQMQSFYAPFFASLVIQRVANTNSPQYNIAATCHNGAKINKTVAF